MISSCTKGSEGGVSMGAETASTLRLKPDDGHEQQRRQHFGQREACLCGARRQAGRRAATARGCRVH